MCQGIAHGFCQVRPARQARQVLLQPTPQVLDQRPTSFLTDGPTHIRRLAADLGLDLIELGDAGRHCRCKR